MQTIMRGTQILLAFVVAFTLVSEAYGKSGKVTSVTSVEVELLYYIVETGKSFEQASADLESAVIRHGFTVLYVHDLGATFRSKGIAFDQQCKVFEVCNAKKAASILSEDMRLNMALPCRISVHTDQGKTYIGLIKPVPMLSALSQKPGLVQVAKEVEEKTILMVNEAK